MSAVDYHLEPCRAPGLRTTENLVSRNVEGVQVSKMALRCNRLVLFRQNLKFNLSLSPKEVYKLDVGLKESIQRFNRGFQLRFFFA